MLHTQRLGHQDHACWIEDCVGAMHVHLETAPAVELRAEQRTLRLDQPVVLSYPAHILTQADIAREVRIGQVDLVELVRPHEHAQVHVDLVPRLDR